MNKLSFYERFTATIVFFATFVLFLGLGAICGISVCKTILNLLLDSPPVYFAVFFIFYFLAPNLYKTFKFKKQRTNTKSFFYRLKITLFLLVITVACAVMIGDAFYAYNEKPKFFMLFENFFVWLIIISIYYLLVTPKIIDLLDKYDIDWFKK